MSIMESAERGEWTLSEILILPLNLALNLTLDLPLSLSQHPASRWVVGGNSKLRTYALGALAVSRQS